MAKIAITVRRGGQGLDSLLDDRFGRAEAFLVVEGKSGEAIETLDNESASTARGAGTAAAGALKAAGVDAVVSGRFGPKAVDALGGLGIEIWIAPEGITAGQALSMLEEGVLERMEVRVHR